MGGNVKAQGPISETWRGKKRRSALTLSDERRPDTAGNGYVSPFFSYMWCDTLKWWALRQEVMDAAVQPELTCKTLNCRAGIHLKVAVKVKLKGCGAWLLQGYVHINASPKVFLFFLMFFFFLKLCLIAPNTQTELEDKFTKKKKWKWCKSQVKVSDKTFLELHSKTALQLYPEQLK